MEQVKDKLTASQIFTRIISIAICAIGASACIFSLTLQVEEIGTTMSSVVWFSGLAGVVASLGGYAAACNPRQGTSHIALAIVVVALLTSACLYFELNNLRSYEVAECAIIAAVIEAAWLLIFRLVLKRRDPNAA